MESFLFYAAITTIIPVFIWILFWMREDAGTIPEPRILILKTFIIGGVTALIALALQALTIKIELTTLGTASGVIIFAFIEEFTKFFMIYEISLKTRFNNERIDPLLYMIIGALGFAVVENFFYLIDFIYNLEYIKSMIEGSYRFIGSTILHMISSAVIGIGCAILYFKPKKFRIFTIIIGLTLATFMHALFNILVTSEDTMNRHIAYVGSWITVILILVVFEIFRREHRIRLNLKTRIKIRK